MHVLEDAAPACLAGPQRLAGQVLLGHVVADHQHAADAAGRLVVDRAVAVSPPHILAPAVAGDRHQLVLVPGRAPPRHDQLDLRADDVPDLGPALAPALAERAGMALRSHRLAVGVVVELDQLRAPPDEHRVAAVEQQPDGRAQALRPASRAAPSGVAAQSKSRVRAPISPPPARKPCAAEPVSALNACIRPTWLSASVQVSARPPPGRLFPRHDPAWSDRRKVPAETKQQPGRLIVPM